MGYLVLMCAESFPGRGIMPGDHQIDEAGAATRGS